MLNKHFALCWHPMITQTNIIENFCYLQILFMDIYTCINCFTRKINYVSTFDFGFGSS